MLGKATLAAMARMVWCVWQCPQRREGAWICERAMKVHVGGFAWWEFSMYGAS